MIIMDDKENAEIEEKALQDFELLTQDSIAFYKTAEITNIYLIKNGKPVNVFSLVVFEENCKKSERINLTESLISISDFSMGISQERVNLEESSTSFDNLVKSVLGKFDYWDISDKDRLFIENLKILPKEFVPSTDNEVPLNPLNSVLKNNDQSGSYIIEFFSEEKNLLSELSEEEYKQICQELRNILPLDLLFLKDRFCNIIFQFPITILSAETRALDNWDGIELKLGWHPFLTRSPEIEVLSFTDNGTIIDSFGVHKGAISSELNLSSGNAHGVVTTLIKNKYGLILWYFKGYYLEKVFINSYISNPNKTVSTRTIIVDGNKKTIPLKSLDRDLKSSKKCFHDWINDREYEESIIKLTEKKEFVQYGKGENNRKEALNDLITIINNNYENGIYLWDPYARSSDIISIIYNCEFINCKIKVITSFSKKTREILDAEPKDYEKFKKQEIDYLKTNSDNNDLNLEIRCQWNTHGWKFHDRFLIFPQYPRPKVWALGTSLNSIGKSHSILMAVNNPQNILDAFEELWDDLKDSVLWKYPEE